MGDSILTATGFLKSEVINQCHSMFSIPSLVVGFLTFFISLWIVGIFFVKKDYGKLAIIIGIASIISGAVFILLILSPNIVFSIYEFGIKFLP